MKTDINLFSEYDAAAPRLDILSHSSGRFVVLYLGLDVTLILPGVDEQAVQFLKQLSVAIDKTANALDDTLTAEKDAA